jgi:type II secretory pathway pseudopilin PulG
MKTTNELPMADWGLPIDWENTAASLDSIAHRPSPIAEAFTLVELLTVIGVIALLAAFLLPGAAVISKRQKINRTQTELAQLETAIDRYHAAYGFYPPDHPGNPTNSLVNPLYYELEGTTFNQTNGGIYTTLDGSAKIAAGNVNTAFGVGGFMNCSKPGAGEDAPAARNFLPGLKPNQIGATTINGVAVTNLVGSVGGPDATYKPLGQPGLNPWRYYSSSPTNNPGAYDLWIQLSMGGKTNLICNWSRQVQINSPLP